MASIADSFSNLPPDDDDLRPPVTPGLPAADPTPAPASLAASPAPVSFYAANSPDGRTSGRFVVGPRRLAGDPAPAPAPPAPDLTPALPAPDPTTSPAPAIAPGPVSRGFDMDPAAAATSLRQYQTASAAQAAPTVPAVGIGSKLDDIDPDTAVSLGLPDASAATGAPPVSAAPPTPAAAMPKVPSPGSTAPAAPNDPTTGSSGTDDISSLLGGGSDPDADARAQYQRDTNATNRYLKSQGGLTTITPTGQEVPATDAQGNQLYKGAVIQPFVRGDDGNAYRVSRDQYGNQHYFNIADGADGTDFHTDPQTGEQFVQVPGADGTSRRETVGQDNFIPAANGIKALAQSHQQDAEQAGLAASQAEQGVAGGDGYDGLGLSQLRESQTAAAQAAAAAQKTLSTLPAYGLNATQVNQRDAAYAALSHYGGLAQEQSDAMDARQQAIFTAQQQRTASMSAFRDAQIVHNQIQAARTDDGSTLTRNLQAVDAGQDIDPAQARRYTAAGLLTPQPQADGSTSLTLTDTARALLPKPDAPPPAPAVDPRQTWESQQQALLREFPTLAQPGSTANQTFIRAFQRAGNDPRKAVQVARAVLGGR